MDYQKREALKQKTTVAGISFVAGAAVWWIVLSSALGWMSPTTAQQQTSDAVQAKVDKVLAPFCADRFMTDKAALAKFIKASEDYDRAQIVQNAISKVGTTKVDYQLSDSCAAAVKARLKSAAKNPAPNAAKKS